MTGATWKLRDRQAWEEVSEAWGLGTWVDGEALI